MLTFSDAIIPVSSLEIADTMKFLENYQRMLAIAFVNEMADASTIHGIDHSEVA
jgi:UDP-N-acetyl-D-mannosaminuronate dehydrogenase